MLGRQIFKSHFGKHYKIHFIKDGPVPRSLKPERFSSSHSARQFLRELRVPESYWQQLASRCDNTPSFRGHQRDHLQAVSHNITSGRIRIYEVDVPDSDALAKSAIAVQDRQGHQYQFATMKQALAFPGRTPQRFSSAQQVYETLYDLAPNLEQLQALATDLQLTPAAEQQTYTQLVDALAEGLAQQHIALYVTAPFKRPEPAGAALEASTNMPGNRKVDLAPAASAARTESKVVVKGALTENTSEPPPVNNTPSNQIKNESSSVETAPDGQRIVYFSKDDIKVKKLYGGELYEFYIEGPDGPLEFAEANVDADEKAMSFFINNNFNPGYVLKGQGFSLTNEVLRRSIALYADDHGAAPESLNGNIIKKNLANFQREYVLAREGNPTAAPEIAADKAIRNISFGREREKVGYGEMTVTVRKYGLVEIDGKNFADVPTSVNIVARKTLDRYAS